MTDYADFLRRKASLELTVGLSVVPQLSPLLFPFQRDVVSWALRRGRAAIFANTGLGKTFMELSWANAIYQVTGRNVLIFAPLAVTAQIVREALKFGIPAKQCANQSEVCPGITVTNYNKMHLFDASMFGGGVLDESSILKSFDGATRNALIAFFQVIHYRLAATATPAPNDFTELGNHSEFLGIMSMSGMLATFFTHDNGDTGTYRLKGHAENDFWRWMCSWSVLLRAPSDLGYTDDLYTLPALIQTQSTVDFPGKLAKTLSERIKARRESIDVRVNHAIASTPINGPYVWWCNLNSESDALKRGIPGAVEVRGSDDEKSKERKLIDFSQGNIRVLITKPSICGFGMNWQHCRDTGFVGMNDSFEQLYQAVRRFWRFGQTGEVTATYISASTEGAVLANIKRKEEQAARMAGEMAAHAVDIQKENIRGAARSVDMYHPAENMQLPEWI